MKWEKYTLITVEDYLAAEPRSEVRHEYLYGTIHAMAGGSKRHNAISGQIYRLIAGRLGRGPCRVYIADVKVRVRTRLGEIFYYPDVMVGCDPTDRHEFYLERPSILFEVTSPSTELTDRREKLTAYQSLASLGHYVIVSQDARSVEWFRRVEDGWERFVLKAAQDRIEFGEVEVTMSLEEIYEGIDFV
jgi:Uma2 family endonuclease